MSKVIGDLALDTNAVIAYLGRDPRAVAWVEAAPGLFLSVVSLGELEYGALHSNRPQENLQRLHTFVNECTILNCGPTTARRYAETRQSLSLKGRPIPEADLWIAAACLEHDLPLLSEDIHFDAVPNLTRCDWTEPFPGKRRRRRRP